MRSELRVDAGLSSQIGLRPQVAYCCGLSCDTGVFPREICFFCSITEVEDGDGATSSLVISAAVAASLLGSGSVTR